MKPKPKHLGYEYASQFKDKSVVDAYHNRYVFPAETFEIISSLIVDKPRDVLDIGCGSGVVDLNIIDYVDKIDAVDFSKLMIEKAKTQPGGDNPRINWIVGAVEEAPLNPPYALITAGDSIHWMEWDVIFPRFKQVLSANGYLAIIKNTHEPSLWDDDLLGIIKQYSTNQDFEPYEIIEELVSRGLFEKKGEKLTKPCIHKQTVEQMIGAFHAMNGFSRDRMTKENAEAFDSEAKEVLLKYCKAGIIEVEYSGLVVWGIPR